MHIEDNIKSLLSPRVQEVVELLPSREETIKLAENVQVTLEAFKRLLEAFEKALAGYIASEECVPARDLLDSSHYLNLLMKVIINRAEGLNALHVVHHALPDTSYPEQLEKEAIPAFHAFVASELEADETLQMYEDAIKAFLGSTEPLH